MRQRSDDAEGVKASLRQTVYELLNITVKYRNGESTPIEGNDMSWFCVQEYSWNAFEKNQIA